MSGAVDGVVDESAAPDAVAPAGVRVKVHPGLCEGWGNCHRWAGAVYPLDEEGFVDLHLLEVPPELAEAARLGADVCPARAITIIAGRGRPVADAPLDHP